MSALDPAAILARGLGRTAGASSASGLAERVRLVCAAIEARRPTMLGRFIFARGLVSSLRRHARVQAEVAARRPRPLPIDPIVIVGFQRTGTTWLHHLMAADPRLRALRFWELMTPSRALAWPLRRAPAEVMALANRVVNPESRAIHEIRADAPEECWILFAHAIGTLCYDFHFDLPEVREHLDRDDVRAELYADYRTQLELLAETGPAPLRGRRLVLKCPDHLWNLDALRAVMPRADIVWCQRDPLASVPSFCSLTAMHRRAIFGRVDRAAVGRHVVASFARGLERARAFVAAQPDARVHHVEYDKLIAAPLATLDELYRRLGDPLDATRRTALATAIHATARARSGHRYALADWGLDATVVRDALAEAA